MRQSRGGRSSLGGGAASYFGITALGRGLVHRQARPFRAVFHGIWRRGDLCRSPLAQRLLELLISPRGVNAPKAIRWDADELPEIGRAARQHVCRGSARKCSCAGSAIAAGSRQAEPALRRRSAMWRILVQASASRKLSSQSDLPTTSDDDSDESDNDEYSESFVRRRLLTRTTDGSDVGEKCSFKARPSCKIDVDIRDGR